MNIYKRNISYKDLTLNYKRTMLVLEGKYVRKLDYDKLPVIKPLRHIVLSDEHPEWKFQLHNYLLYHENRFWCMWSFGPEEEALVGQSVVYSTSRDGINWEKPQILAEPRDKGYGYIARGFWVYKNNLLGLAAYFTGPGAFGEGKKLSLHAYRWHYRKWKFTGVVFDDAINNFPPQLLEEGKWMMTGRDVLMNVYSLIGAEKSFDEWKSYPVVKQKNKFNFLPDEPFWWRQDDGNLAMLLRDNSGKRKIFRCFSMDDGKTWTEPVKTNFPNATTKFFGLKTSRNYRVFISNANRNMNVLRKQMHLSITHDGRIFTHMARIDIPNDEGSTLQYPHVLEYQRNLLVAFSRKKRIIELIIVPLERIEKLFAI
ncbi:MAG: exo-alpha-sialidase [Candidatus Omnitrophica bacterium]|nr:exo-alpha-sialidase [Candidatus Omnitrophota bacterium]MCM8829099.1 exo-alpha-sialidase [Candidatus Omnitrophota bacterium]